jgi:hypothetical protein
MSYIDRIGGLLIEIRFHFRSLNDDEKLTEADKKQLKEFYLQNFIAPKARKLLEQYFPEEFGKAANSKPAQRTHTHQDR